jgi:hypothetical protein
VRLLTTGVYYNRRDSGSGASLGQLLLGLGVLVLAGLVLGGGAIVLLSNRPGATPTHIAAGPTPTAQASSSSPTPTATPLPTETALFSLPPTPTLIATGSPTAAPTITPQPTALPTATPVPTPAPTPVDCAVASQGTDVRELVLGIGNTASRGPIVHPWCIRDITIHPAFNPGTSTGYGTATLFRGTKKFDDATYTCTTFTCGDGPFTYVPPRLLAPGSTLRYQFQCQNSTDTVEDDCADSIPDGMTITIHFEVIEGP